MRLQGALNLLLLWVILSSIGASGHAATASDPAKRHNNEVKAKASKPVQKTAKPATATADRSRTKPGQPKHVADRSERTPQTKPVEHAAQQHNEHKDRAVSDRDRSAAQLNAAERERLTNSAPPDRYVGHTRDIGALKVVGHRETGRAAWYGGRHVGQRTASGDVLDSTRSTAAHRSLPLNSLARVTNLNNGRSVVVTVTDRGPHGRGRLIDVSPRAADELDMKRDGVVPVAVEPVANVRQAAAD
jgi:rare lipoprotein A